MLVRSGLARHLIKTTALSAAGLFCRLWMAFTLAAAPLVLGEDLEPPVRFQLQAVSDDPEQLHCQFTPGQLAILEKLNRADVKNLVKMGSIVVPNRWDLRELDYSPMPSVSKWAGLHEKSLVIHQQVQAFGAYERGKLVHWGPVSSGDQQRPTPSGYFHLNWKSKGRRSTVNRDWFLPWVFNFMNRDGIAFHQYELPGYPASHGCVRLLGRDAQWLYGWGDQWELGPRGWKVEKQGTPVWVIGGYDYEEDPPWMELAYLSHGARIVLGHDRGVHDENDSPRPAMDDESVHVSAMESAAEVSEAADSI